MPQLPSAADAAPDPADAAPDPAAARDAKSRRRRTGHIHSTRPDIFAMRAWFAVMALMCLLPWVAIPWDMATEVAGAMGRILNLGLIPAFLFVVLMPGLLPALRGTTERTVLGAAAAFVLYASLTGTMSQGNPISTYAGILAILAAIVAGAGAYAIQKHGVAVGRGVWIWIVAGTLPVLTLPLLIWINAADQTRWTLKVYGATNIRAVGHFTTIALVPLLTASAALLPAGAGGVSGRGQRRRLVLLFALLALTWSVLFWSGSRAGMVAIAASATLAAGAARQLRLKPALYTLAAAGTGAALSLLYYTPDPAFGLINRVAKTARGLGAGDADAVASGRLDIWAWTLGKIAESPWIGYGYLPMHNLGENPPPFYHTHNIVLEYMLSFGLPAAGLVIALVLALYIRGWRLVRRRPRDPYLAGTFLMVTLLASYSMLSGVLLSPYQLTLFCAGLAVFAAQGPATGAPLRRFLTGRPHAIGARGRSAA